MRMEYTIVEAESEEDFIDQMDLLVMLHILTDQRFSKVDRTKMVMMCFGVFGKDDHLDYDDYKGSF